MKLKVTSVDYEPSELKDQVPFKVKLLRLLPGPHRPVHGPHRPDYWLGELLKPLFWMNGNQRVQIDHVVLWARWQDTQIAPFIRYLPIGIAYVIDPTQITDETVNFDKCKYVAIGVAHETLAGRIGRLFDFGDH
jgi:hypothetical protein